MKLSVIIPTYNGGRLFVRVLKALRNQTVSFELIIVDSGSTDGTAERARKEADIFLSIDAKDFDHGGTRTLAAKKANGEILVFLTQDALLMNDTAVETLVKCLEDPQTGAVFGKQLPYENTSLFGKHLRHFNYPDASYVRSIEDKRKYGIKTAFFSDSFSAYKKEVLEEVGYFKNGLIVGEDMHIAAKILCEGYRIAYCASAAVYHSHSYSALQEFKRYFDTGVFHTNERWLLETFGKAEGEGKRYVKSELNYLLKHRAFGNIPAFFIRNLMKYAGYKLGRHYRLLPSFIVSACSMHTAWWEKRNASA